MLTKILIFVLLFVASNTFSIPASVVIIRHGEKLKQDNTGPYLSFKGIARSLSLPQFFLKNFQTPIAFFAQGVGNDHTSMRPIQTLAPTSMFYTQLNPDKANNFVIQQNFLRGEEKKLANFILSNKSYNNGTVIICWSHDNINVIAENLGVKNAPQWPKSYDIAWVINYDCKTNKVKEFKTLNQNFVLDCDEVLKLLK